MQRMETYLCSGGRRRRRWRGGCFILFPGVASLSFGLFFFCRCEMVAPPSFFPSLLCLFAFVFGKKAFGLVGPKLSRVLYSGSAPVFALVFLCLSGFFLPCFCLRFSLPASVFFPGLLFFCLWFSGPIPLCSASQFPPVLPLSFLPVLPPSVRPLFFLFPVAHSLCFLAGFLLRFSPIRPPFQSNSSPPCAWTISGFYS